MLVQLRTPSSAPLQQINFDAAFPPVGSDATVIGYGVTSPGGSSSTTLLEVTLPVVSFTECDSYYNTIVEPTEICTCTLALDSKNVGFQLLPVFAQCPCFHRRLS
jgi:Trypsin